MLLMNFLFHFMLLDAHWKINFEVYFTAFSFCGSLFYHRLIKWRTDVATIHLKAFEQ